MKINRNKLIRHLQLLACNGQLESAVINPTLGANGLTIDHLLLVKAPAFEGAEPLADRDIGIADIELLVKALRLFPGDGNEGVEVELRMDGARLVVDDSPRGVQKLLTAGVGTIKTHLDADTEAKLFSHVAEGSDLTLNAALITGICDVASLYKADLVEIFVTKEGCRFAVGRETENRAEFFAPAGWADNVQTEFSQLFGAHLLAVLNTIDPSAPATLRVCGTKKPICIEQGGYRFLLSPRSRAAEEKPGVKGAAAPAAA